MEIFSLTNYNLGIVTHIDGEGKLELDELEGLAEAQAERREMVALTTNKGINYSMIRRLKPVSDPDSLGAINFMEVFGFDSYYRNILLFQQWQPVEGGSIQVRVAPGTNDTDLHGYAVARPQDDQLHDLYLRVWHGKINSVAIMPRSDDPLPKQGELKDTIVKQMHLIEETRLNEFTVWINRMKEVK